MNDYPLRLTGPQLRVLHETLSMVLNEPDSWPMSQRDLTTLSNAHHQVMETWRLACRTESTPA